MAQFNGLALTLKGLALQTKAQTGVELRFSRVAYGDGQLEEGQLLRDLTALISHKMDLPIVANTIIGNGTSKIQAVCRNVDVLVGFDARELGVFATDPDEGEILYCVGNAGDFTDYIPAGNSADLIETIVEIITVIKQATNVTATIDTSLLFTTQVEFSNHIGSLTPHPNAPSLKAATTAPTHFWGQVAGDNHLHPITLAAAQVAILGSNGSTIPVMAAQIDATNRELSNIALYMQAMQTYPDYNALIAEDFTPVVNSDVFSCQVTSVGAGSNSLGVATLQGIVVGSWYTVTDGVNQEQVQVTAVIQNGTTLRAQLTSNIVNTYNMSTVMLYRSTAQIIQGTVGQPGSGNAQGAGNQSASVWAPTTLWTGTIANSVVAAALLTTQANSGSFTIAGNMAFDVSGNVTLV